MECILMLGVVRGWVVEYRNDESGVIRCRCEESDKCSCGDADRFPCVVDERCCCAADDRGEDDSWYVWGSSDECRCVEVVNDAEAHALIVVVNDDGDLDGDKDSWRRDTDEVVNAPTAWLSSIRSFKALVAAASLKAVHVVDEFDWIAEMMVSSLEGGAGAACVDKRLVKEDGGTAVVLFIHWAVVVNGGDDFAVTWVRKKKLEWNRKEE